MPTIEKAANLTDALDRLTGKSYPDGSGMTDVLYTYDDADAFGLGRRTGMIDASGSSNWVYDARGRLVEESRTILGGYYVTGFTYDAAGRLTTVQYPTGETVTQTYSDRGLPYSLSGNETGTLVSSALYNQLGAITQINLGNGVTTEFDYWGLDHGSDHYGMLYEIKTYKGETTHQQVQHTWDDAGNLVTRYDAVDEETENFTYDFLDRLTAASGAYSRSYSYDAIGNIVSKNSVSYTYGSSRPHAVTQYGNTTYDYDANGNMVLRGDQTISWNSDNMPAAIAGFDDLTTFVYDGDGSRVIKTEDGETTLYVNEYYELNLTTGNATTYYYLGERQVALKAGENLRFVHQDHLTGTSLTTDSSGDLVARVKYYPYGETRSSSGALGTDRMFTGQRLDGTGLYFYGARYYDPVLGRFISPDTLVPNYINPQSFNRYSYCLNNPLRYVDPSGSMSLSAWFVWFLQMLIEIGTEKYGPSPEAGDSSGGTEASGSQEASGESGQATSPNQTASEPDMPVDTGGRSACGGCHGGATSEPLEMEPPIVGGITAVAVAVPAAPLVIPALSAVPWVGWAALGVFAVATIVVAVGDSAEPLEGPVITEYTGTGCHFNDVSAEMLYVQALTVDDVINYFKEHQKGKSRLTRDKHQRGTARREREQRRARERREQRTPPATFSSMPIEDAMYLFYSSL